jgi:LmbE family N-acetylglucosaminyl deacetylase
MKKYNLLVVAHPDDETIFFGGLLQIYRRRPWKIVCVTDGNADGQGTARKKDFLHACAQLKVKDAEMWTFPDRFESRLDIATLQAQLSKLEPAEVFTHGILGEYGHPHHQDVCLAVHRSFTRLPLWSVAYNCFGEKIFRLPRRAYDKKCEVLSKTYFSETQRFSRWLPASNVEGFAQVGVPEVESLYDYLALSKPLVSKNLKAYAWFEPYLESYRRETAARPF